MAVNRCICSGVRFAEILRLHRDEGLTFDEIRERTGACDGCTSCEPYVRLTLSTGVTDHPVLTPEDAAEILRSV